MSTNAQPITLPFGDPNFPDITFEAILKRIIEPRYQSAPFTITPKVMEQILTLNEENRPLRRDAVLRFALDMKEGRWEYAIGDTMSIDTNGLFEDGQHRAHACVLSGVPFKTLIVTGCTPGGFVKKDKGTMRNDSDVLAMTGEHRTNLLAAALRIVIRWEAGKLDQTHYVDRSVTPDKALALRPGLRDAAERINKKDRARLRKKLTPATLCFLQYACSKQDAAKAEEFFNQLDSGVGMQENTPVIYLHRRMEETRKNSAIKDKTELLALCIKSWNLHIAGKPGKLLTWHSGGAHPEAFPILK